MLRAPVRAALAAPRTPAKAFCTAPELRTLLYTLLTRCATERVAAMARLSIEAPALAVPAARMPEPPPRAGGWKGRVLPYPPRCC